jgi:hypothetical protein
MANPDFKKHRDIHFLLREGTASYLDKSTALGWGRIGLLEGAVNI